MIDSYARQFVLTELELNLPVAWPSIAATRYRVHHHPELCVLSTQRGERTLTLIGYAIDPFDPSLDDASILGKLADTCHTPSSVAHAAGQLGGRWALLAEFPEADIVLHDACGLREVFYSDASLSTQFCASQASTAAKLFALEADPEAEAGFLRTRYVQDLEAEYWWPGDSTRYRGVRCLLPNHYLDLRTRALRRYALLEPVQTRDLGEVVAAAAPLLRNLVSGVARREDIALPLTAGWDSRAVAAACHRAGVAPFTYTLKFPGMSSGHQDLVVSRQMARALGWKHRILACPSTSSPQFAAAYKNNVEPAHDNACAIAEGLVKAYPRGYMALSGHSSEVARCAYLGVRDHRVPLARRGFYGDWKNAEFTARDLADLTEMDPTPFVLRQYERWLEGAIPAAAQTGLPLLDLFYWEQRVPRWAGNGQSQWDFIHERFTPFNCRPLLLTLLQAEIELRRPPHYGLYRELVRALCPELLGIPVNPGNRPRSVVEQLQRMAGWGVDLLRSWKHAAAPVPHIPRS
jgi:hypothetical protein